MESKACDGGGPGTCARDWSKSCDGGGPGTGARRRMHCRAKLLRGMGQAQVQGTGCDAEQSM
eukprot:1138382-Pelagomonas_calceolata.AAC.11